MRLCESGAGALARPARALQAVRLALGALVGLVLLACLAAAPSRAAAGGGPLDHYLDGLHTFRASFSQTVTDAHGRIVQQATGELIVLRPGKFRWETHPAGVSRGASTGAGTDSAAQLLVADGHNLWFYDQELEQVTVRPEGTALSATPAMLLSGGAGAIDAFDVRNGGRLDGLDWVQVTPKAADADFKHARLGFAGGDLERMILEDKLGQTVTLRFEHPERNAPVAAAEVSFTPPPGADVIGTPHP